MKQASKWTVLNFHYCLLWYHSARYWQTNQHQNNCDSKYPFARSMSIQILFLWLYLPNRSLFVWYRICIEVPTPWRYLFFPDVYSESPSCVPSPESFVYGSLSVGWASNSNDCVCWLCKQPWILPETCAGGSISLHSDIMTRLHDALRVKYMRDM